MSRIRRLTPALLALMLAMAVACQPAAEPAAPAAQDSAPAGQDAAPAADTSSPPTSHDELVARANEEGRVRVMTSLDPSTQDLMTAAFNELYPDIEVEGGQMSGTEQYARVNLEMSSGTYTDWDVSYAPPEYYDEFAAYYVDYDFAQMVEDGVWENVTKEMVDPTKLNIASFGSQIAAVGYNPELLDPALVPATWEDLLKPELKGNKFIIEARLVNIAPLAKVWGREAAVEYVGKLADQQPSWVSGHTANLTRVASGDLSLYPFTNYHDAVRISEESPETLQLVLIEPIPGRISITLGVPETSTRKNAGLLYMDWLASPEAQAILDEVEPLKSSIFKPGGQVEARTAGKELSIADFELYTQFNDIVEEMVEAAGFPQAPES